MEQVLARVQQFDPAGVGARDLRECLLIQLRSLGIEEPLVRGSSRDHLDPLQKRDFRGIARALGVTIEEIAEASRRHRQPRAAARPRLRRRGAATSRPTSSSTRSATSITCAQRGRHAALRDQLALPRRARDKDADAEGHQATTSARSSAGAVADQVDPPAPAHDLQGDADHHPLQRDFFEHGVDAPAAAQPERRRRRHRHARIDGRAA